MSETFHQFRTGGLNPISIRMTESSQKCFAFLEHKKSQSDFLLFLSMLKNIWVSTKMCQKSNRISQHHLMR